MLKKIISGGQTGTDRAALDAALAANFPCGGFCPKNRLAEDGSIDPIYPLIEIEGGYEDRTEKNVLHSDGTVVFYENESTGGTSLTIDLCKQTSKPNLLIDMADGDTTCAAQDLEKFVMENRIQVLNVAGPRASECNKAYAYVERTIQLVINGEPESET